MEMQNEKLSNLKIHNCIYKHTNQPDLQNNIFLAINKNRQRAIECKVHYGIVQSHCIPMVVKQSTKYNLMRLKNLHERIFFNTSTEISIRYVLL